MLLELSMIVCIIFCRRKLLLNMPHRSHTQLETSTVCSSIQSEIYIQFCSCSVSYTLDTLVLFYQIFIVVTRNIQYYYSYTFQLHEIFLLATYPFLIPILCIVHFSQQYFCNCKAFSITMRNWWGFGKVKLPGQESNNS